MSQNQQSEEDNMTVAKYSFLGSYYLHSDRLCYLNFGYLIATETAFHALLNNNKVIESKFLLLLALGVVLPILILVNFRRDREVVSHIMKYLDIFHCYDDKANKTDKISIDSIRLLPEGDGLLNPLFYVVISVSFASNVFFIFKKCFCS